MIEEVDESKLSRQESKENYKISITQVFLITIKLLLFKYIYFKS